MPFTPRRTPSDRITAAAYRKMQGLPDNPPNGGDLKPKAQIRLPKPVLPNKTEKEWMRICQTRHPSDSIILYEPWSLRLPSGTRYTPDVVVIEQFSTGDIKITCYEVKGPHLHQNSANSIRAFKEAKSAYPWMEFVFTQNTSRGWAIA